jgi:hypothetical protein
MEPNQVAELKRMLQENARLKRMVAERNLEIEVMKEIASKKMVGVSQRIPAVRYATSRGVSQRRAGLLIGLTRALLTY